MEGKPQWLQDLESRIRAAFLANSPALRPIGKPWEGDSDLDRMEVLVLQIVRFGSPNGVLDEQCFACRMRELLCLLIAFHRTYSAGRLLDLDEAGVLDRTWAFVDGYFAAQHSQTVQFAELLLATNRWLGQCAEQGFPELAMEN